MSTERIETSPQVEDMLEKHEDLKKRCAFYESLHPDQPARYDEAKKKNANAAASLGDD